MPAKNILIADDDQVILDLLEEILQMEGYETFLVSNGEEAVETTKKYPIDVAILDKKMPIMDGIEALKRIKKIDSTVEVLIMTGYADIETLRQSLIDYGAFDYLLKPHKIRREEICNAVRNALLKRDHALKDDFIEKELNNRILQLEKDFEEKTRQLRESQIKYKEIVENSTDGILITQDEKLKFVNPMVLELTGFTEEEILNIPFIELVYPEDRTMVMDRFTRRVQGDESSSSYIFRILRKDGDSFWAEINSVRTIWGKRPAVMANIKDINDRVESENKLQESEERFKDMATLLPTIIGELDLNFYFTYANEVAFETFGYSHADFEAGLNVVNMIHPDDRNKALKNMKKVLEGKELDGNEYRMLRKDGSELTMLVHARPIHKYGRVVGIRSTLIDITKMNMTQEVLREREKDLEIKTKSLEELNAALRVLLKRREEDKRDLEEKVLLNVQELLMPFLQKIKNNGLDDKQETYLSILESNLNDIISPFSHKLSSKYFNLTPTEIQVASLVKGGRTSKEIAELLNSSRRAIEFHRDSLRNKFGLKNKKANLRSFLLSL